MGCHQAFPEFLHSGAVDGSSVAHQTTFATGRLLVDTFFISVEIRPTGKTAYLGGACHEDVALLVAEITGLPRLYCPGWDLSCLTANLIQFD